MSEQRLIDANKIRYERMLYARGNGMYENVTVAYKDEIDDMPTIEPQQWIPCSERLPEDDTDVLVWFEYFRYGDYNCLYQTYGIGDYSTEYDSWMINHETGWHKLRVIAWMPLPEPWRGEERGQST